MQSTLEKQGNEAKLTIRIPAEKFGEAIQQAYLKGRGKINVPGFRKGKAPRKMIETMYGTGVFYEDAIDIVFPEAYDAAVTEHGLETVDRPRLDVEQIGEGQELVLTATVTCMPEVTLGQYKGIEVPKIAYTVSDEDVERELARVRERQSTWEDVDRPAAMGDRVTLDYAGFVGEEQFEGGTAQAQVLELGSGTFIPGFEEQLVGAARDEERDVTVTFPEEYHSKELAGKEAVFHCTVHDVKVKEIPELDDEFAKDVSEFDTLEAYKKSIAEKQQAQNDRRAEAEFENKLLEAAAANATIDVPEVMIERQIDYMLRDMEYRMQMQGINMQQYMEYTGMTPDVLRGQYREDAEKRTRVSLVLGQIQKEENITADDEAVDAEIARMAEAAGKTVEEYTKTLGAESRHYVEDEVLYNKTIKILKDTAVRTDPVPEPEEAPEETEKKDEA